MNEYLQQQMDTKLFEGVDEQHKAQFVGNFFHWVKCRFQDCNMLQTKSELNMRQQIQIAEKDSDASPTAAASKKREDKADLKNWATGVGHGTPAFNKKDTEPVVKNRYPKKGGPVTAAQTTQPTIAESVARESKIDMGDWATGVGHGTPNRNTAAVEPSAKAPYPKFPNTLVQTDAEIKTKADSERKQKIAAPSTPAVLAALEKEAKDELVKPHQAADNAKDTEPK
jgi:hypothetical protein